MQGNCLSKQMDINMSVFLLLFIPKSAEVTNINGQLSEKEDGRDGTSSVGCSLCEHRGPCGCWLLLLNALSGYTCATAQCFGCLRLCYYSATSVVAPAVVEGKPTGHTPHR